MAFVETNSTLPTRHNPYLHKILLSRLEHEPKGHVLDVPSGPGYLLRDLKKLGHDGIAGEIDEELHCFADIDYQKIDMSGDFPFPSGSFDYVTSIEGIEHIENHFHFLRECRRVLKPGGKLYLTTPNIHNLASRWNFFISGFHSMAPKPIPLDSENVYFEHINPISLNQLYFYCHKSGLKIQAVQTYRHKRGATFLYFLLYPLFWWGNRVACKTTERDLDRRKRNKTLSNWLTSRANLTGSHTIITAQAF